MKKTIDKESVRNVVRENFPFGYLVTDNHGKVVDMNEAAESMTGFCCDEVVGRQFTTTFLGEKHVHDSGRSMKKCNEIEVESKITKKDGKQIDVSNIAFPLQDDHGKVLGSVNFFRDITPRKKLERERKTILPMLAHDMKNQVITSIGYIARILHGKAGEASEKQNLYLSIVRDNLTRMLDLLDDFLEFSRLENREYIPQKAVFSLVSTTLAVIEDFRLEAEKRNLSINFEYPESPSCCLKADRRMIVRVISNLLGNAIQYSKPFGCVTIRLFENTSEVIAEIEDTGIGIPQEQLAHIFEPFYRIANDSNGSGLGLAISKTIIEAHGGRIFVESDEGKGSKFCIALPNIMASRKDEILSFSCITDATR